jgi:hypothetical protein
MMQIRCQRCGWNFTLSRDALARIVEEIKDSRAKHYMIECPKCRHSIKVQSKKFRRYYRPDTGEE